jgi:hypothetical protein
MVYGDIVQRWRLAQGAQLRAWPKRSIEAWGPWFLTSLFAAILVWEQVRLRGITAAEVHNVWGVAAVQ